MRVHGALVLGSVLVLMPFVRGQNPTIKAQPAAVEESLMFPATKAELRLQLPPDDDTCQKSVWASNCSSTCSRTADCATQVPGIYIECRRDYSDGCCKCLDGRYECRVGLPSNCSIKNCRNTDECEPGHVCRQNSQRCCRCLPEPDCVPQLNYPSWWYCPNTCTNDGNCSTPGHTCQRNLCGGCHCYLKKQEQNKQCCYDHRSGCAKNECSRQQDCKTGLCVPDPECDGGCICDPGEGCKNTGGPNCTDNECKLDKDCKEWGPNYVCSKSLCGGCRCVDKEKKKDCCPDFMRPPWCPVDCEYDEQCQRLHGKLAYCGRRKCGGCKCDLLYSTGYNNCVSIISGCDKPCSKHSDCGNPNIFRCQRLNGCCKCVALAIADTDETQIGK